LLKYLLVSLTKDWAENNTVISYAQFGFRKGRSTVDAMFVLNAIRGKFINNNCRLACAFIDFKKAFDCVYRNGLWFKLHKLGVRGRLLRLVRDVYSKIRLRSEIVPLTLTFLNALLV